MGLVSESFILLGFDVVNNDILTINRAEITVYDVTMISKIL